MDQLGGLIKTMPKTAILFLIGSLAIGGLPPFNGFVSEWLLFQAVLAGPEFPEPLLRFLSPAVGALLALAAALAAACFVRLYGIAFLGRPRSPEAARAREVPAVQLAAMGMLAGLCLAGGLFGGAMARSLQPLLLMLTGAALPGSASGPTALSLVAFNASRSSYDAPTILAFLLISGVLTTLLVHRLSSRRSKRSAAWDCGFPDASASNQYSASSFSQPLRRVYGSTAFGSTETIDMPAPGDHRPARLRVGFRDHAWDWLYLAPARFILASSLRLNQLQFLTIRSYLVLMFSALIVLLVIAAVWF